MKELHRFRQFLTEGVIKENTDPKKLGKELFDFLKTQGLQPGFFKDETTSLYDKVGKSKNLAAVSLLSGDSILIVVPKKYKNSINSQLLSIMKPQTDWNAAQKGEYVFSPEGSMGETETVMFNKK